MPRLWRDRSAVGYRYALATSKPRIPIAAYLRLSSCWTHYTLGAALRERFAGEC